MYRAIIVAWFALTTASAIAHDPDHRDHDSWYQSIKQPDSTISCCGLGDAYFCNDLRTRDDRMFCTVTDTRPDKPRGRPHVPVGTVVEIPADKLVRDAEAKKGNPTGQGVIWMRAGNYDPRNFMVYCYMMPDLT